MKSKIYFLLIFNLFLFGCQINTNPCSLSEKIIKDLNEIDSLIKIPEIRLKQSSWMNYYNEPSLLDASKETYRFFWSSSFDGIEIYRIERNKKHYDLTIKKYSSHQDTIGITKKMQISDTKWNNIVDSLNILGFWTYPSHINRKGLDGASWNLEGYKPIKDECTLKNYHYTSRWSPNDTTYVKMCKLLYELKTEKGIENLSEK